MSNFSNSDYDKQLIFIKIKSGQLIAINIKLNESISTLKSKIEEKNTFQSDLQRIIYAGKQLEDDKLLQDCYGIEYNSILYLLYDC